MNDIELDRDRWKYAAEILADKLVTAGNQQIVFTRDQLERYLSKMTGSVSIPIIGHPPLAYFSDDEPQIALLPDGSVDRVRTDILQWMQYARNEAKSVLWDEADE